MHLWSVSPPALLAGCVRVVPRLPTVLFVPTELSAPPAAPRPERPISSICEFPNVNILSVVGARPQFVKAAALSRTLRRSHHEVLLHTGQHYDDNMSARFFRDLDIPAADYELDVGSGTHAQQTAAMLVGIENAIRRERPDALLVFGDTNSTLAGALAAAKLNVKVAHVEAGLRSFNRGMPEEINRVVVDHLSHWLFCPSESSKKNLAAEGISHGVHVVGDVMAEAVELVASCSKSTVLGDLGLQPRPPSPAGATTPDRPERDHRACQRAVAWVVDWGRGRDHLRLPHARRGHGSGPEGSRRRRVG